MSRSKKAAVESPVILGEKIEGTDLMRRMQGGRPISPIYTGDDFRAVDNAQKQAEKVGLRSVTVFGMTYVLFGIWYGWSIPEPYLCPRY